MSGLVSSRLLFTQVFGEGPIVETMINHLKQEDVKARLEFSDNLAKFFNRFDFHEYERVFEVPFVDGTEVQTRSASAVVTYLRSQLDSVHWTSADFVEEVENWLKKQEDDAVIYAIKYVRLAVTMV